MYSALESEYRATNIKVNKILISLYPHTKYSESAFDLSFTGAVKFEYAPRVPAELTSMMMDKSLSETFLSNNIRWLIIFMFMKAYHHTSLLRFLITSHHHFPLTTISPHHPVI